ncbi:class I SAM-dependent methyltransferase [Tsuneonella troitsensis]|uniref:class I SAM-dependent methyltransferase n=1 Tax=Tsuneonella troitsensis TaxID=292222 RepID=UPI00070FED67|nr:class I SAM-dependent methyltransferase [Tsuneonella troitsensis]
MSSIAYYDANADDYFAGTVDADVTGLRNRFFRHVEEGGRILDAGCGSGRDAKAFQDAGYNVTAFDGSVRMAELAREYTGLEVLWLQFDQVEWRNRFDGIWCSASLLHVGRDQLLSVFDRLTKALKPGGVWYLSMKEGTETRVVDGRSFTDVTSSELRALLVHCGLGILEEWKSDDVRPGRSDRWVNIIAQAPRTNK